MESDKIEDDIHHTLIDVFIPLKTFNNRRPFCLNFREKIFQKIVLHTTCRKRLGVIIFVKSRFVWFLVKRLLWIILPVYEYLSFIIAKGIKVCYRDVMVTFSIHAAISTKTRCVMSSY